MAKKSPEPGPEQSPDSPESEPTQKLCAKCWKCNHAVRSSLANTRNFIFTKQKYFNHTELQCVDESCQSKTLIFHDKTDDKAVAIALQYPTTIQDYCDEAAIQEVRRTAVGANDIEILPLSQRSEALIARWGDFLQHITVDITDFQ